MARALGCFSVERGGNNEVAKRYAIDVVKRGQEVLVVFPEGEIYYLTNWCSRSKAASSKSGCRPWSK